MVYYVIAKQILQASIFTHIDTQLGSPFKISNTDSTISGSFKISLAGMASSVASLTMLYPLDLLKTRRQADLSKKGTKKLYKSTFDCFNKSMKDTMAKRNIEGFKQLYRGYGVALMGVVPYSMVLYPTYEVIRRIVYSSTVTKASKT